MIYKKYAVYRGVSGYKFSNISISHTMHIKIGVVFLLFLSTIGCFSQSESIKNISQKEEKLFKRNVLYLKTLIQLFTHPTLHSIPDSTWHELSGEFSQGLIIETKSGLRWNINSVAPEKPSFFLIKANSNKGRNDSKVAKRIEYHKLVKELSTHKNINTAEVNTIIKDTLTKTDYKAKFIISCDTINGWNILEKYYKEIY